MGQLPRRPGGARLRHSSVSSAHLLLGLAERQRLGLREHVRHQQVLVPADRGEAVDEADEVGRDQLRALVDELVEGMLAVRARLADQTAPVS